MTLHLTGMVGNHLIFFSTAVSFGNDEANSYFIPGFVLLYHSTKEAKLHNLNLSKHKRPNNPNTITSNTDQHTIYLPYHQIRKHPCEIEPP